VIRVFVSSVSKGLVPVRQQILSQLRTAGYDVGAMESFGAQSDPPLDVCLRELRKSDVVVLMVGPRYGSLLPQGISYTQAEFREARALGLPVLAFRVPDGPEVEQDEKDKLAAFLTEVGSLTTYKALATGDSLDSLSGEILAALTAARDRGQLGNRYSIFQPFDRFFSKQLGANASLFSHEGPFVGRENELGQAKDFLRGTAPVLLLKAPGGSGKSRLLLELAKYSASTPSTPTILFADTGGQWTSDDISRLPVTPLVLVVDDAHRRADLDRLIFACLQHNPNSRFVVSCRPSVVNIVTPHIAALATTTSVLELALTPLGNEEAEALAKFHLGADLAGLAARLVRIADRNPLVIAVGGKCIAERRVAPEILERTPEVFRSLVLDRLLDDPGFGQTDSATRRKVLEVAAAVGPVVAESDDFLISLSSIVGVAQHEARRFLASLERAGFFVRRGRLVRVSPDVLADHLLYRAAVDETGHPTGFIEEMVRKFSPALLDNILANAAELDWRASAMATHESVLATTWRDLLATLPEATHSQRGSLLEQLKRSAVFAPEEVMRIAEWIADHRDAPPDEKLRAWGLEDSFERVADKLTDLFAFLATHPDFTTRCVQRLWDFAVSDSRPANPNPSHPRRRLQDLLTYEWRADWQSPNGVHARVIEFVLDTLKSDTTSTDRSWAIALLGSALHRIGEANESSRSSFTIRQFSLAQFLPQIAARRTAVISSLRSLALSSNPIDAAAALRELARLFQPPRGPFGTELDPDEIGSWQPETEQAIKIVTEVAQSAPSEVIRFLARRSLRETSRQHWPAIAPKLEDALKQVPATSSEALYDLLVGLPWEEQEDDYEAEQRRVGQLCNIAARDFWAQHKTASAVVAALLSGDAAIQAVGGRGDSQAGRLARSLVYLMPEQAASVVSELVRSGESGWRFLRPAVLAMYEVKPGDALSLVDTLTRDSSDALRAYAADPLQWMTEAEGTSQAVLDIIARLSTDTAPVVKRVAAQVLRRFRDKAPDEARAILVAIDWGGDITVANAVLDVLHPKYGLDPGLLRDEDIDGLLRQIEALQTLEGRAHDILEFVSFAATRRPAETVDMLLQRVLAVNDKRGESREERWTPMPYDGRGLSLHGLAQSKDYPKLLRRIRDAQQGASALVGFWIPTLFRSAVSDLRTAIDVLREWVVSENEDQIIGAANLLRGFEHSIVFTSDEFVADLLDAASKKGQECLDHTRSELFATAMSGVHSGTPGQPAPRYLSDKASAQQLATKYTARPVVRQFYNDLVRGAESSIERDMLRWEEEGDE
jgi:hypothetical protein